jgi:hypothetical protein
VEGAAEVEVVSEDTIQGSSETTIQHDRRLVTCPCLGMNVEHCKNSKFSYDFRATSCSSFWPTTCSGVIVSAFSFGERNSGRCLPL